MLGADLFLDALLDGCELGTAVFFGLVGAVVVVVPEGLFGFVVPALETEPAGGFADEKHSDAEDQGWDGLDGETEAPLVGVLPFGFADAGPEGYEEAPGNHWPRDMMVRPD